MPCLVNVVCVVVLAQGASQLRLTDRNRLVLPAVAGVFETDMAGALSEAMFLEGGLHFWSLVGKTRTDKDHQSLTNM